MSPEALQFELEIKSELKKKSRKIQRLEFVSDKIEGGDCKREVMCTVLVIPWRKMSLCEALHGRHPWSELELLWEPIGGSPERGRRGGGRGEEAGAQLGGGMGRAAGGAPVLQPHCYCCVWDTCSLLLVVPCWMWGRRRKEEKKRKEEREGKKRKEKYWENFWNLKIST
jgi:hypothetical protein